MEDEIDRNLDALNGFAGSLKHLVSAVSQDVEAQINRIDGITKKTDHVDDQVALNRARLDRIK